VGGKELVLDGFGKPSLFFKAQRWLLMG